MKRTNVIMLLLGAAIVAPMDADAQRGQKRNRERDDNNGRVERLEPIRASGRVADRTVYRPVRAYDRRNRVVYSSRGYSAGRGRTLWVRTDWGRVRMRPVALRHRNRVLNQSRLRDVIGNRAVNQLRQTGRRIGLRGKLRGRWVGSRGFGSVLVVSMDGVELAELVDFDRDGFVDDIFVTRHGGRRLVVSRW